MIPFFRKFRYNLAQDNQPASPAGRFFKYSRYAIGEIVLVVIGILIALQINNWNENRKSRKQETLLLEGLQSEFQSNLKTFDSVFVKHIRKEEYVEKLILFEKKPFAFGKLDTVLEVLTYNYTVNLSSTIYKSSVNSGKIDLISDSQLKNIISSFEDKLIDFQEEELIAREMTNLEILPYINDNIALRYPLGSRNEEELREDDLNYRKLVTNTEFRNRLINLKSVCWDVTTEGRNLRKDIVNIIDQIEVQLRAKSQ